MKSLNKMKTEPKKLEWEKEFDKEFHTTWIKSNDSMIGLNPVYAGAKCYLVDSFKVKQFIQSLIQSIKEETIKEEQQKVKVVWNSVCEQIKQEAITELLKLVNKAFEETVIESEGHEYGFYEKLNNLLNKKDDQTS